MPRSRISGVIPPLPQYAFMVWCSVKAQVAVTCFKALTGLNVENYRNFRISGNLFKIRID
jgi:hypothetical protein